MNTIFSLAIGGGLAFIIYNFYQQSQNQSNSQSTAGSSIDPTDDVMNWLTT